MRIIFDLVGYHFENLRFKTRQWLFKRGIVTKKQKEILALKAELNRWLNKQNFESRDCGCEGCACEGPKAQA